MPARTRLQTIDWVGLARVAAVLAVCAGVYRLLRTKEVDKHSWHEVQQWLKYNKLTKLEAAFKEKGITSLQKVLDLSPSVQLSDHPPDVRLAVEESCRDYRDSVSLKLWLAHRGLDQYLQSFQKHGVHSLSQLLTVSDHTLQKVTASDYTLNDYTYIKTLLLDLSTNIPTYQQIRDYKPAPTFFKHIWSIVGLLLFTLLVGALMIPVSMNYAGYAQTRTTASRAKHSIIEFVTGKYLSLRHCKVDWQWQQGQTVGKTVSFVINFFQRNGGPYAISDADKLLVEIVLVSNKFPSTVQLASPNPHSATVSFAVHKSGAYQIAVLIAGKHIEGSPFQRIFKPGPLEPSKSGFVGHTSIVVCTEGVQGILKLDARDEYGNMCTRTAADLQNNIFTLTVTETTSQYSYNPPITVKAAKASKHHLTMEFLMMKAGCYQAISTYNGSNLKNSEFTILVLTAAESDAMTRNLDKKSHNVYYEARLLTSCTSYAEKSPGDKVKKVYCYISPKQLTIKEFAFKIFPIRLFTFRVCPLTKLQLLGVHNEHNKPVLVIDDGCQPPVKIAAKDRNIIAAVITNFLLKNIGGSETFKDKQDFFYQEVRSHHAKHPHSSMTLRIDRANLLEASLKATKNFSTSEWCKNFSIKFVGEEGLDWGGLRREWFELICKELFDPSASGLFCRFSEDTQALVLPNPKRPSHLKLKLYEFAGKIVGKCLYESSLRGNYIQMVKARFSRSFLAQLIGLRVTYKNFEQDDPELYMSKVKYIEENSVEGLGMTFTQEEYTDGVLDKVVELVPNGSKIDVTDDNKLEYLDALAQYKLNRAVKDEVDAFLKGLNELVPDQLLSMFDENELELLICGTGVYSITDLKQHCNIIGNTADFKRVLDWFWTIIGGFTQEQMARLLQFTTGCSQLPPGGFCELSPEFQITYSSTYDQLPTAHTCFNQLCLPDYDSMEQMHRALLLSINEGNVGFGML